MLRKALCIGLVCFMAASLVSAEDAPKRSGVRRVLLFLPNVVLDIVDVVNVSFGTGPGLLADVHLTRYAQVGGGGSVSTKEGLIGRQIGCWHEDRYGTSLVCMSAEFIKHEPAKWVGVFVKPIDVKIGPSSWEAKPYKEGEELDPKVLNAKRDMLGVGAALHVALVAVEAEVRLTEVADAVVGLLTVGFVDIRDDDIK